GWWWFIGRRVAAVRVVTVEESTVSAGSTVLNASGYVTARRQATVSANTTGKVVEVVVEEGMKVREDQVVARLDDSTHRANLALAEAQLEAARRALAETDVRLEEARLNLRRTQGLTAQGISSQAALDAAQAEVGSFEARLALGREQVAVAERQVAVRQRELDDTVIRAPFAGVVVSKDAQPGEMVSPISAGGGFVRTGICTIVDMDSLEIEVDVNESYIARVEGGQRVEATLDAYPDWRIPARVITTVPTADRQKATVKVRIGFDKLDPRLLPDMGVKVNFLDPEARGQGPARPRVLVPRAALRRAGSEDVVFVVREARVERRVVRLGAAQGEQVAVLAGLNPGEQVVVEGPVDLADGDRVRLR
ncbi:MAG: efflux RND transporter periplasmic adaptor subunit, partial [Acidobacteria bacterium]|nr:efflux RND transporter periplasmic adaptor subunit [Acidobacteriota bacterium]